MRRTGKFGGGQGQLVPAGSKLPSGATSSTNFFSSSTTSFPRSTSMSMTMTGSQSSFARVGGQLPPLLQQEAAAAKNSLASTADFTADLLNDSSVATPMPDQQVDSVNDGDMLQQRLLHNQKQMQQIEQKVTGAREVLRHSLPSIASAPSLDVVQAKQKGHDALSRSHSVTSFPQIAKSGPRKGSMADHGRRYSKGSKGSNSIDEEVSSLQQIHNISARISLDMDVLCGRLEVLEKRHDLTDAERALQDRLAALEAGHGAKRKFSKSVTGSSGTASSRKRRSSILTMSAEEIEEARDIIRTKLCESAGSELQAYKSLDCNGNGDVSISEFIDGLNRLKIPWQDLTGLHKREDLFKCFDQDGSGQVDLKELFPDEAAEQARLRATTPEWWSSWVRKNHDCTGGDCRQPKWVNDTEASLQELLVEKRQQDQAHARRRWMKETMKRLRFNGKSPAACRQVVASHIAIGTGPRDEQGVRAISKDDVQTLRRSYFDDVNAEVRKVQKIVYDLRTQRRDLQQSRHHLSSVTTESKKAQEERERKEKFKKEGFGAGSMQKMKRQTMASQAVSFDENELSADELWLRSISKHHGIPINDVEYVHGLFKGFDTDNSGWMAKDAFSKLMHKIIEQHLTVADLDSKWKSVLKLQFEAAPSRPSTMKDADSSKETVDFERFLLFFSGF